MDMLIEIIKEEKKVIIAILILLFISTQLIGLSIVHGESMEPTLSDRNFLIYQRSVSEINHDDIILVQRPGSHIIVKRVIGLPGDHVLLRDGMVFVNGEKQESNYETIQNNEDQYEGTVKEGTLFILGDNRQDSLDSRSAGLYDIDHVKGKIIMRLLPFETF